MWRGCSCDVVEILGAAVGAVAVAVCGFLLGAKSANELRYVDRVTMSWPLKFEVNFYFFFQT